MAKKPPIKMPSPTVIPNGVALKPPSRRKKLKAMESPLETNFALQIKLAKLPEPTREYKFTKERRWKIDFYWEQYKLAVEIEGGLFGGRHVRPQGFKNDIYKYNCMVHNNIRLLRFTSDMVSNGEAIDSVLKFMREHPPSSVAEGLHDK